MKKNYETPEMKISIFEDGNLGVIVASGNTSGDLRDDETPIG